VTYAPASQFTLPELTDLWNLGYSEYVVPIHFGEAQLDRWMRDGSFDLDHSVVLLADGQPVGFSFLGRRGRRGWIGGFGIHPAHRRRGYAATLMGYQMAVVGDLAIDSVQLEVLSDNPARKVYVRSGFAARRSLVIMEGVLGAGWVVNTVQPAPVPALLAHSQDLHVGWPATWQREPASLSGALAADTAGLCLGDPQAPTGFLIYRPVLERIHILDAAADDAGAADLIGTLALLYPQSRIFLINEPSGSPVHKVLAARGCRETRTQVELRWTPR